MQAGAAAEAGPGAGAVVDLDVHDLLANGQGVGRIDGLVVFVWGPLPGERARVRITERKPRYMSGELVELLSRSPDRVEPFCGVFGTCGGCQVQHLAYGAQLAWKRGVVSAALERIGAIEGTQIDDVTPMDHPRAYRNKMSLVVGGSPERRELGFYQARSHDLVPITDCPIVLPKLDADIGALREALAAPGERETFSQARHVVVRRSRAGAGVAAITTRKPSLEVAKAAHALRARMPGLRGVVNSFDPAGENVILGRREKLVAGEPQMEESLAGLRFRVSVHSFFQVNGAMVEKIFAALKPDLREGRRIIDLYCGAGTFAVFFAAHGADVDGFEENQRAVEEARVNAKLNGVAERARFHPGRVEALVELPALRERLAAADVVFLDPPRKGSDETTLRTIIAGGASEIWYLSCNPATLARDAAVLVAGGFALERVTPFDMFPQTGHVEALARFRRGQSPSETT